MTYVHKRAALLAGAAMFFGLPAGQAVAQEDPGVEQRGGGIGEIVVTARRVEESLQETPLSITAVNSEIIEARGIESLVDLTTLAPNFKVHETPGGIGAAGISVRGISAANNTIDNDSPIGVYVDGVAMARVTTLAMDIVEPESIQVLRGPQGTLFGRNTTGGAVVIETHRPTDDFSGVVKAGYGSFNATTLQARIDTGLLGDTGLKASFAYTHRERDGIQDNREQPDHLDPGAFSKNAYWFKLAGDWDSFRATLTGDYSKEEGIPIMLQLIDGNAALRSLIGDSPNYGGTTIPFTDKPLFTVDSYAFYGLQRVTGKGLTLTLEYDFDDHLTAKAIGALRGYHRADPAGYGPSDVRGPVSAFDLQKFLAGNPLPYSLTGETKSWNGFYGFDYRDQKSSATSLELQLIGDYGDFNFVAGAYYWDEGASDGADSQLPYPIIPGVTLDVVSPRRYTVDSKSKALFAQVNWSPEFFDNKLELTGGIRYTDDKRVMDQTVPATYIRHLVINNNNTSFLLSANYQWTDGLMTYVKYSTGYRAGGFNVRAGPPISPVYAPEKIKSWEAGFKLDALDRRLRLNAAAFYNKYDNFQVGFFKPPEANNNAGGSTTISGDLDYKGFEAELTLVPIDGLTLTGSIGYIDYEFNNYPQPLGSGGALISGCSLVLDSSGAADYQNCASIARLQFVPKVQWGVSATYVEPTSAGDLSFSINYDWTDNQAGNWSSEASNFPRSSTENPSYGLLDARIALSGIPLSDDVSAQISVFGKNLTDNRYSIAAIDWQYAVTRNFPSRQTFGIEGKLSF